MTSPSDRAMIIQLVEEAVHSGASQFKACECLGITTRTLQRWKNPHAHQEDQRPLRTNYESERKLKEDEVSFILKTVNTPEFASMPPSQIVPTLADRGVYIASESSFYRVMRRAGEQNHRGRAQRPSGKPRASHCATKPNQVWSWDITYLPGPIKGLYYFLYLIIDIFSRDIIGWEVWEDETAEQASRLIRKAVMSQGIRPHQTPLILHSDNGSPMKGATMLATLYELGVTPSRSRPRVSNDNPYSESIFKTCKYRPQYPSKGFVSLEASRMWCLYFVHWYRHEHHHSGIKFLTPNQLHKGKAEGVLEARRKVYELAKTKAPQRWSGNTRDWTLPEQVWLNPVNISKNELRQLP